MKLNVKSHRLYNLLTQGALSADELNAELSRDEYADALITDGRFRLARTV